MATKKEENKEQKNEEVVEVTEEVTDIAENTEENIESEKTTKTTRNSKKNKDTETEIPVNDETVDIEDLIVEDSENLIEEVVDKNELIDEEIKRKVSKFSRDIALATKKERKQMYRSDHVITEYGDEDIETDSTRLKDDYIELATSADPKVHKILEGKLMSYRYAGEERKSTILAEIEFGAGLWDVVIPSYLLFDYDVSKYVEPDKIRIIEENIKRRLGSKVKFIVSHLDEKNMQAFGNRLLAQSIIGISNYVKKTAKTGMPRINDSSPYYNLVKGTVIYTSSKYIIVDALGCDITVNRDDLDYMFIGDARQYFKTGDSVNVRIKKVSTYETEKYGTKYRLISAEGSVKEATEDKRKVKYDKIRLGSVHGCEVTYIEGSNAYVKLSNGYDCMCKMPDRGFIGNVEIGSTQVVKITTKVDDKLFVYGVFQSR